MHTIKEDLIELMGQLNPSETLSIRLHSGDDITGYIEAVENDYVLIKANGDLIRVPLMAISYYLP